jgi:hypothetical protein
MVVNYCQNIIFRCIGSFVITLAISAIPLFFENNNLINLILVVAVNCFTFVFFTWFFGLTGEERKTILNLELLTKFKKSSYT